MAKSDVKARLEMRLEYLGKNSANLALKDIKRIDDAVKKAGLSKARELARYEGDASKHNRRVELEATKSALRMAEMKKKLEAKGIEDRKTQQLRADKQATIEQLKSKERAIERSTKKELASMMERGRMQRHSEILAVRERDAAERKAERSKVLALRNSEKEEREKNRKYALAQREEERNRKRREKMLLGEAREKARFEKQMLRDIEKSKRDVARSEARELSRQKRGLRELQREKKRQFAEEKRQMRELARLDKDRRDARSRLYGKAEGGLRRASVGTGAAIMGGGALALNSYLDLSAGVAKGLTLDTDLNEKQLGDLIKNTMKKYGGTTNDTSKAAYDIASAGFGRNGDLEKMMEASSKLAIGGATDIATAADGLTSILTAWGLKTEDLTNVTDRMFQAMSDGKITIDQLVHNIGSVSTGAKGANVSVDEVFAMADIASKAGLSPERAFTGIDQVILSIIRNKNNKQSKKAAKKLGLELGAEGLMNHPGGLAGWLMQLIDNPKFNQDLMNQIFTDKDGARVVNAIASAGSGELKKYLGSQNSSTGATDRAFGKVAASDAFQAQRIKADLNVALIELGEALIPLAREMLPDIQEGLKNLHEILKDPEWRKTIANVAKYGSMFAVGGLATSAAMSLARNTIEVGSAMATLTRSISGANGAASGINALNSSLQGNSGVTNQMGLLGGPGGKIALAAAALEGLRQTAIWLDKRPGEIKEQKAGDKQGEKEQHNVDSTFQESSERVAKAKERYKRARELYLAEHTSPMRVLANTLSGFGLIDQEMNVKTRGEEVTKTRKEYDRIKREHQALLERSANNYSDIKERDTGSATSGSWLQPDDWQIPYHIERLERERALGVSGLDIDWGSSRMEESAVERIIRESDAVEMAERAALASFEKVAPTASVEMSGEIRIVTELNDNRKPQTHVSVSGSAAKFVRIGPDMGRTAPW